MPFFRHPDDFTLPGNLIARTVPETRPEMEDVDGMPAVRAGAIREVIQDHLKYNIPWLSLATSELRRDQLKKKVASATGKDAEKKFAVEQEGEKQGLNVWEFALLQLENEIDRKEAKDLRKLMFEAAARLRDEDVLTGAAIRNFIRTEILYGYNGSFFEMGLNVGIRLTEAAFPDFFRPDVNPIAHATLTSLAAARVAPDLGPATDPEVQLPSLLEQQRIAFETLYYRHLIRQKAASLDRFPRESEEQMSAALLHELIAQRFREVNELSARVPSPAPGNPGGHDLAVGIRGGLSQNQKL